MMAQWCSQWGIGNYTRQLEISRKFMYLFEIHALFVVSKQYVSFMFLFMIWYYIVYSISIHISYGPWYVVCQSISYTMYIIPELYFLLVKLLAFNVCIPVLQQITITAGIALGAIAGHSDVISSIGVIVALWYKVPPLFIEPVNVLV